MPTSLLLTGSELRFTFCAYNGRPALSLAGADAKESSGGKDKDKEGKEKPARKYWLRMRLQLKSGEHLLLAARDIVSL